VNNLKSLSLLGLFCLAGISLRAQEAVPSEPTEVAEPVEPVYTYREQRRDPFRPLMGQGLSGFGEEGNREPGIFDTASVELKGILKTKTGRWAILRTTAGEDSYLAQNGKIHDSKRKIVEGYVGIVKEKSLVIIGPNNQVTELMLEKKKEEEEGP
jgi:hypothetical protein